MNNLRWLISFFDFGRNNRWMFGNRRKNRGMMLTICLIKILDLKFLIYCIYI